MSSTLLFKVLISRTEVVIALLLCVFVFLFFLDIFLLYNHYVSYKRIAYQLDTFLIYSREWFHSWISEIYIVSDGSTTPPYRRCGANLREINPPLISNFSDFFLRQVDFYLLSSRLSETVSVFKRVSENKLLSQNNDGNQYNKFFLLKQYNINCGSMCLVNGTLDGPLFNKQKEYNTACIVQVDGTTAKETSIASWSTAQPTGSCASYFLHRSYLDTFSSLRGPTNISRKPGADPPPPPPSSLPYSAPGDDAAVHLLFTNIISCDNPFEIRGHLCSGFQYSLFFLSILMLRCKSFSFRRKIFIRKHFQN